MAIVMITVGVLAYVFGMKIGYILGASREGIDQFCDEADFKGSENMEITGLSSAQQRKVSDFCRVIQSNDRQGLSPKTAQNKQMNLLPSLEEGVFSHGKFAGKRIKEGKNQVVLIESGRERILDEVLSCRDNCPEGQQMNAADYDDIRFSPSGQYLSYVIQGWEERVTIVYDTKASKKIEGAVAEDLSNSSVQYDFTPDEKYLYVCSYAGMSSDRGGKVYTVPDFKMVFDVFHHPKVTGVDGFLNVDCSYSDDMVDFHLSGEEGGVGETTTGREKTIRYNFSTGRVELF